MFTLRKLEEVRKHQFLPPHATIVKFHTSWEECGRLYQQFELCSGTLQDWDESDPEKPQVTLFILFIIFFIIILFLPSSPHSPSRP